MPLDSFPANDVSPEVEAAMARSEARISSLRANAPSDPIVFGDYGDYDAGTRATVGHYNFPYAPFIGDTSERRELQRNRDAATRERLTKSHTYTIYGAAWQSSRENVARWIKNHENWSNAGGSMRGVAMGSSGHSGSYGRLPYDLYKSVDKADYVIYSYATPQIWHIRGRGWIDPDEKYSVTTTRQMSGIRCAMSQAGLNTHKP